MRRSSLLVFAAVLAALQGCAATRPAPVCDDAAADPYEAFNRPIFAFDIALDRALIRPAANGYRAALPEFVRDRIHDFLVNLKEPLVFANDVLQGRGDAAAVTGKRFVVNSTAGVAGLFDRASGFGLARQSGDFGQTLYAWGFADGPYLVLPILGPSNVRDLIGSGVDMYAGPAGQLGNADVRFDVSLSTTIADGLDLRSRNIESLDELEKSSLDFYAYLRSVTRQARRATLLEATGQSDPCRAAGEELVDPGAAAAGPAPAPEPAAAAPISAPAPAPAASAPAAP